MPQPAVNDLTARRLIEAYEQAEAELLKAWRVAALDPRRASQTRRLRELLDTHQATMEGLVDASRTWWGTEVAVLHAAGATYSASIVGSSFTWTQAHLAAVEAYAQRTWEDVAARLQGISDETRALLRREIASATRAALLESRTAVQAGRDLAKAAAKEGLWSVEYANGARHTMRDYADSVIRTTTAEAYNRGSVEQARGDGYEYVEYFDGEGCGVEGHNDPTAANGLIVPIDEVVYLSHPRCRRAVVPANKDTSLGASVDIGPEQPPAPAPIPAREPRQPRVPWAGRA